MEQTIREKVEGFLIKFMNDEDEQFGIIECADQIMQLIPSWKTFSEDCKPELGDWFMTVVRGKIQNAGEWQKWRDEYLERYIERGYQFFIIPQNKNQKQ